MTTLRLDAQQALAAHAPAVSNGAAAAGGEADLRRVAAEFEALLLSQLTSALNPSGEEGDDEGSAFGGGGMSLYRRMFSERIAQAMAESGGIGIGEMLVARMRPQASAGAAGNTVQTAIEAAKTIRRQGNGAASADATKLTDAAKFTHATKFDAAAKFADATPAVLSSRRAGAAAEQSSDVYLVSSAGEEAGISRSSSAAEARDAVRPRAVEAARLAGESTGVSVAVAEAGSMVELRMPVDGRITSSFGVRRDPIHGRHKQHRGLDIAAPRGTPIEAAASGTVVFAGWRRGYGNTVTIEHADGRRTRYAHADELLVSRGDVVDAGQTIAKVGSTGRSTGPHLHFEVFEGGERVDPLRALAKGLTLARR